MKRFLLAAVCVALAGASAVAADDKKKPKADDAKKKKTDGAAELEKAFKKLDTNKDGKLSMDEFKELTTAIPQPKKKGPDLAGIFAKLDKDNSNSLSPEEFKSVKGELAGKTAEKKKPKK